MMFLTFPDSIGDYPKYIFKGFEKVEIEPGETKTVEIFSRSSTCIEMYNSVVA